MKKQFTLLALLTIASGVTFGQSAIKAATVANKAPETISVKNPNLKPIKGTTQKAGGDVLYSNDFSNAADWTIGTNGQGTFIVDQMTHSQIMNQTTGLDVYMNVITSTTASNGVAFFNGIQYIIGGTVTPQDTWIESPVYDLTGKTSIIVEFEQAYRRFNYDVVAIQISEDNGTTWTNHIVNSSAVRNGATVLTPVSLNLQVSGSAQTKFRFNWKSDASGSANQNAFGSGYGWMIDDFKVIEGYSNNIQIANLLHDAGTQGISLSKVPVTQAQSSNAGNIGFGAIAKNVGSNSQNITLNVTSGGYTGAGSAVTVAGFNQDTVSIAQAQGMTMPSTVGTHPLNFNLTSNNVLDLTQDDSGVRLFEVTNSVMAVDQYDGTTASLMGSFVGWASASGDGEVGTYFEVFEPTSIGGIQIGIYPTGTSQQSTYIGRTVKGKIYEINETTGDPQLLDATSDYTIAAGDFGTIIKTKFEFQTVSLEPGKLYVATAASLINAGVPVMFAGTHMQGYTVGFDGANFVNLIGLDDNPALVEVPVVRLDFQSYLSTEDIAAQYGVTAYPNPFNNSTDIAFELANDSKVSIKVTDLMGRTVVDLGENLYNAGTNKVNVDASSLSAGVYNYTLTIGNNVITKKIVKK